MESIKGTQGQPNKFCSRCGKWKPRTEEYFYPARKTNRRKLDWQSNCKECWKEVNRENKQRRKKAKEILEL